MSLLEVRGLSRSFGAVHAVQDLSFTVERGTILGFIGPNGAGKTTTLRMLATLDAPDAGEVFLDGKSAIDEPDKVRPHIGYMPDRYGTYSDTTVYEMLDFFARAYRLRGAERAKRLQSVINFTGVGPLVDKLTSDLSKGMKQRVALGRTLLHDPKLLLLDEPADGLDPHARIELRELLKALAAQGKAIVVSSHILSELSEMCDAALIIEQGRLLARGKVGEILQPEGEARAARDIRIRIAGSADIAEKAERLLLTEPGVSGVVIDGPVIRFRLQPVAGDASSGTEDVFDLAAARLLRALLVANVPVCAFEHHRPDLEDAFMRVTRGRIA